MFSTILPDVSVPDGRHAIIERRNERMVNQEGKKEDGDGAFYCFVPNWADFLLEKMLEEVLQWIDGLNCAEKQDVTLALRQPGTCRWLFDTNQYKTWRGSENSFLWLRGKGKESPQVC